MRLGLTISTLLHAIVLAWCVLSFSARRLDAVPTESLPVDIVSSTEFSKMTAGVKTAPKAEAPKPLVEKISEEKTTKESLAKVSEKQEIQSAASEPAPPKVEQPPKRLAQPSPHRRGVIAHQESGHEGKPAAARARKAVGEGERVAVGDPDV